MWHGFSYFEMGSLVGMKEKKKRTLGRMRKGTDERSESERASEWSFRVRAKSVVRVLQGYTRLKVIWDVMGS
jgi:hypothetical protein